MRTSTGIINYQTTTLDDGLPGYHLSSRFRTFAEIAGDLVVFACSLAFLCYLLGNSQLEEFLKDQSLSPYSCSCFALSGLSLALQAKAKRNIWMRRAGKVAALIVIVEAIAALLSSRVLAVNSQSSFGWIDVAQELTNPGPFPQAMPLGLTLVGLSLILLLEPPISIRQQSTKLVTIQASIVSAMSLVGYSATVAGGLTIPPAQALVLSLLFLGIIFAQPDRGPIAIVISSSIGGLVARRLFFTTLGVPLVLVWLNLVFEQAGLYQEDFGSSLLVAAIIIIFTAFIILTSASLERLDRQRMLAESAQRENERRLTIQYMLTRILAESGNLSESATKMLQTACQTVGWATGSLWLVDKEAGNLHLMSFWHLPGINVDEFKEISQQAKISKGSGLPGKVWASSEPVCYSAASEEADTARGKAALRYGLHTGFAFPMTVGNEVVGVIEFFSRETGKLDDGMLQIFTAFAEQLGQFVQRKQAQEELLANQERTRMIIESAYDAFISMDEDGNITDWNAQAERTFLWSKAEALGRNLDKLIIPPPLVIDNAQGLLRFQTSTHEPLLNTRWELTAIDREGRKFPVELALFPIMSDQHRTYCAFVHDITERKRAEELLIQAIETEQRVAQAIVENAPVGIARLDKDFAIAEVNQVLSRLLAVPIEDLIGSNLFDLLPSLPRSPFMNTLKTLEPFRQENYKVDLPARAQKQETYWDLAIWPIKGEKDNPQGIILLASDATERVELVNQRDDFVATLTHDLKAPLMGAERTLELLGDGAFGSMDNKMKEVITKLRRSNQDLLNMIENLLEIYRLESGSERMIFEELDLCPLITKVINELSPIAQKKNIRIQSILDSNLGNIQADPLALYRVLTNLLINAIKFTPQAGSIKISAEKFGDNIVLNVQDSGIGIKPEEQEKAFQRFWRAESSIYKTGSGLGLYLCWQIVSAHNGKISLTSEHNIGTTFSITLPIAQQVKSRAVTRSN